MEAVAPQIGDCRWLVFVTSQINSRSFEMGAQYFSRRKTSRQLRARPGGCSYALPVST